MTRLTRHLLSLGAWAAFLVAAPLVITYSLGYRVRPTAIDPVAGGAFLIRTFPDGATVYLNGKEHSGLTRTAVSALAPGPYTVRLEKSGYRSWEKQLLIEAARVTDIRHVRLLPGTIDEEVARERVTDFSVSPRERWVGLVEAAAREKIVRVVPYPELKESGVTTGIALERRDEASFFWSPDEKEVAVITQRGNKQRTYLVKTSTGVVKSLKDSDRILGWLPDNSGRFLVQRGTVIERREMSSAESPTVLSRTAAAAAVSAHGVLLVEQSEAAADNTFRVFTSSGTVLDTIPSPPLNGQTVESVVYAPSGDVALLTHPNQTLFVWYNEKRTWHAVSKHAERVQWSPDSAKLLWQESEFDLWVLNVREERSPLSRLVPELVVRLSTPVQRPQWFAGSQHITFFEDDILYLAEIDGRDGHRTESLTGSNRGDGSASVNDDGRVMFLAARRNDRDVLLKIHLRTAEDR